jgi:hypothetical protein
MGCVYTGQGVTDNYDPVWQIQGFWLYPKAIKGAACSGSNTELRVQPDMYDSIHVSGRFCWTNGKYDAVKDEYDFSRFPKAEEMDDTLPMIARQKVAGKLKWYMVLKLECNKNGGKDLVESLYEGVIDIPEEKDDAGKVIRKKYSEANVNEQKYGRGQEKRVTLYWSRPNGP